GPLTLVLGAIDAADVPVLRTETIHVDNVQPTISLSGPTDVPTTAGTQYVTASASAGASGVAGISCSVDGGAWTWYPGASAAIPVSGIGVHDASCYSQNNARDASGTPASSPIANWTVTIRAPAISTVAFAHVADALRCH